MAKSKKIADTKIDAGLIGVAGEFFVAAELSRRGFVATLTQRNTKGIDIIVSSADGATSATIQVKCNRNYRRNWILTEKAETLTSKNFFYVFVNLETENQYPEFHIVPSKLVADFVTNNHNVWRSKPSKNGKPREHSDIRKFLINDNKYLNNWDLLNLD